MASHCMFLHAKQDGSARGDSKIKVRGKLEAAAVWLQCGMSSV
jgi:hypothetical protein